MNRRIGLKVCALLSSSINKFLLLIVTPTRLFSFASRAASHLDLTNYRSIEYDWEGNQGSVKI